MIYFIDEDVNETEPYVFQIEMMGYETRVIDNADDAFNCLVNANDIEAVVIDVMLATKQSSESMFDAFSTNNFVTTGLKLLDELVQQRSHDGTNLIPNKVVLFSAATRQEIVDLIVEKKEKYKIAYFSKLEYDADDFSEELLTVIKGT